VAKGLDLLASIVSGKHIHEFSTVDIKAADFLSVIFPIAETPVGLPIVKDYMLLP
jgi:hypothetical protein